MIPVDILLANGATYRKAEPGERIFHEGCIPTYYYHVMTGRVGWSNLLDLGRELLHNVIERGGGFGEMPFFDEGVYAASAIADVACTLLRLRADRFKQILTDHPAIHFDFSKSMAS